MTETEIQIAMAELAGWRNIAYEWVDCEAKGKLWFGDAPRRTDLRCEIPNYPHDLNAVQDVFRGLDEEHRTETIRQLLEVLSYTGRFTVFVRYQPMELLLALALANPLQWCEAILKATQAIRDAENYDPDDHD